MANGIHLN